MSPTQVVLVVTLVALVIVLFGLALAEASLLRVRRSEAAVAADAGDHRAVRVLALLDDLPRVMNAVLFAVLLAQVTAAMAAGVLAGSWFGGAGVTITTVIVTLVLFVYGEAIPKTIAVAHPLATARRVAGPVRALSTVLRPIVSVLVRLADLQAPGSGVITVAAVSEEELRLLAGEAASAGEIDETDAQLIDRSFTFGDLAVCDIVVPLSEVVAVATDASVGDALQIAIAAGHRRLPIFEGGIEEIVGFVRLRDLAGAATTDPNSTVSEHSRPVLTVSESKPVAELLRAMQASYRHLAVVLDESGGTVGIVTVEDVAEELIGTIEDR